MSCQHDIASGDGDACSASMHALHATTKTKPSNTQLLLNIISTHHVCHMQADFGQSLRVLGSSRQLGGWSLQSGMPMEWTSGDIWTCETDLPAGQVSWGEGALPQPCRGPCHRCIMDMRPHGSLSRQCHQQLAGCAPWQWTGSHHGCAAWGCFPLLHLHDVHSRCS
jgi:hypothetical protein